MRPLLIVMALLLCAAASIRICRTFAEQQVTSPPAIRAYMIQNNDDRWLRRTIPGQINIWVVDQGVATIWTNKQESYRVWTSLGYLRDNACIKEFILLPVEAKE